MNRPLITTKSTNKVSKISAIISGVADIVFAIFMFSYFKNQIESLPKYLQDEYMEKAAGLIIFTAIAFGVMIIYTAYQFAICRSYVDVYEDRLEGKGIQNIYQIMDFSLSYDRITNVTYTGFNIYIHTPGGKYRIISDAQTAKKVFDHYNRVAVR